MGVHSVSVLLCCMSTLHNGKCILNTSKYKQNHPQNCTVSSVYLEEFHEFRETQDEVCRDDPINIK